MTGETTGLPSVGIMTENFVSAAELMARVLGAPDHPFAVIAHPISSATAHELGRQAASAAEQCARLLSRT